MTLCEHFLKEQSMYQQDQAQASRQAQDRKFTQRHNHLPPHIHASIQADIPIRSKTEGLHNFMEKDGTGDLGRGEGFYGIWGRPAPGNQEIQFKRGKF